MRRFLALCAGAALSVAVAASGCGDIYNRPGPRAAAPRAPRFSNAGEMGQPVTGSASQESESTGPPNYMPITPDHASPDGGTTLDASLNGKNDKCRPSSPRWSGRGLGRGPRGWRPRH